MSVAFTAVKCPECGANLTIEEGRDTIFCSYCGTKILMTNENEYTYRHVDEAGIKQAETDRLVKLRQLDIADKARASNERVKRFKIILSVILGIVGGVTMFVGYNTDSDSGFIMVGLICLIAVMYIWLFNKKKENEELDVGDKIKVPSAISDYESKSYAAIEAVFHSAGFNNVKCVPLNDLRIGLLKKPGMVESITVNGHSITCGGKKFLPDASVVISYHSLSDR